MGHVNKYPATGPYMGRSWSEKRALARILTKSRVPQQHWRSGAPPGVANLEPVFELWAQI